jgi:ABC-2 type transport system permease protein
MTTHFFGDTAVLSMPIARSSAPGPVRAFADNQPVTSIVNTIRDLLAQQPVSTGIWTALVWCLGVLIVAYALAIATYHRKIA